MTTLPPFGEYANPFQDYDADAVVEDAIDELEDLLYQRILARLQRDGGFNGVGRILSGEEGRPKAGGEARGDEIVEAEGEAE